MKYESLNGYILIEEEATEDTSIIIPDSAKQVVKKGKVVFRSAVYTVNATALPFHYRDGDTVFFLPYQAVKVSDLDKSEENKRLVLVPYDSVIAVVIQEKEKK